MKVSISIFCVNYNSYNQLTHYIESIQNAYNLCTSPLILNVFIADNSTAKIQIIELKAFQDINAIIYPFNENLGYLGAVEKMIYSIGYEKVKQYDYVIISNVDLLLSESFFQKLIANQFDEKTAWIAPKILSLSENRDRNPKIIKRPKVKHIKILMVKYKFPFLNNLYNKYFYLNLKKRISSEPVHIIYAGHGSLMILTKAFTERFVDFKFPSFLFGEEIFFGELIHSAGLNVCYSPEIVVEDLDHASTSTLKSRKYCRLNYQSLNSLLPLLRNE